MIKVPIVISSIVLRLPKEDAFYIWSLCVLLQNTKVNLINGLILDEGPFNTARPSHDVMK